MYAIYQKIGIHTDICQLKVKYKYRLIFGYANPSPMNNSLTCVPLPSHCVVNK